MCHKTLMYNMYLIVIISQQIRKKTKTLTGKSLHDWLNIIS